MTLPGQTPKFPKLPLLLLDGVLLLTAGLIYHQAAKPLGAEPLTFIFACVAAGAVLAAIPFIADYAREDKEALADRQRGLEALASTTATAAEQISIAAAGLHEIAALAQKNVQVAEHLPQKLEDKISDFTLRLSKAANAGNEALQQQLDTLRATETGKLESTAAQLATTTAALVTLEAAVQQDLALIESFTAKAAAVGNEALQAEINALRAAETEKLEAAADRLAATTATLVTLEAAVQQNLVRFEIMIAKAAAETLAKVTSNAPPVPVPVSTDDPIPGELPAAALVLEPASTEASPAQLTETPAEPTVPPKRKRSKPAPAEAPPVTSAATDEAPPVPSPAETSPFLPLEHTSGTLHELGLSDDTPLSSTGGYATQLSNPPMPFTLPPPAEIPESSAPAEIALSSDGLTRLTATAYIGIGNRLFARGSGPGLSWEKGVPLQFVSIGKWRWETADASGAVSLKLYKNDLQECAALGTLILEPGHQHEVTANF